MASRISDDEVEVSHHHARNAPRRCDSNDESAGNDGVQLLVSAMTTTDAIDATYTCNKLRHHHAPGSPCRRSREDTDGSV